MDTQPRWLQLSPDFPPGTGFGSGVHVGGLVSGLAAAGVRSVVGTRHPDGPAHRLRDGGRTEVVNAAAEHGPRRTGAAWYLADQLAYNHALAAALAEVVTEDDPVAAVHNHHTAMVPLACRLAARHDAPLITTVHLPDVALRVAGVTTDWLDRPASHALELEGYRRSRLIVVPSRAVADWLAAEYPWCADRVTVLPLPCHGVPVPRTDHSGTGPLRVLTVGRCDPNKGHRQALEALRRLPSGSVTWRLLGGGPTDRLCRQAAEAGVPVEAGGIVDHAEVMAEYPRADVLLAPSPMETYGLAVQEALASGLPVVAADIPAVAEQITDGENGLLVPLRDGAADVTALTAALRRLLTDPALRHRLGTTAAGRPPATTTEYAQHLLTLHGELS